MAVSFTLTPAYPLPSGAVEVVFTAGAGGNYARLWCTDAPPGSTFRKQLDDARRISTDSPRVEVHAGPIGDKWKPQLEVGGKYSFATQEYTLGASTYGGGYEDDPNSFKSETKSDAESTATIYVGQQMTARIGAASYGHSDLVLYVFNSTIRKTTERAHGEISPRLERPSNERARIASESTTMPARLQALEDITATSVIGNVDTLIQEMRTDIPAHFNDAVAHHPTADTDNDTAIERLPEQTSSPEAIHLATRTIRERLRRHMENDSEQYHTKGGSPTPDLTTPPVADIPAGPSVPLQSYLALADAHTTYEAHRVNTDVHDAADAVNTLTTTLGPLIDLLKEFLRLLHPGDTTVAPSADNPAVVDLSRAGFTRG